METLKKYWPQATAVLLIVLVLGYYGTTYRFAPFKASQGAKMASDISLHDMNGKVWTLSALRGKWILVNFWATWCGPCLEEMPGLERFSHSSTARRMVILAISESHVSHKKIVDFLKKYQITYTVLNDPFGEVADSYHVSGLPTTALISPNGHLMWVMEGAIDFTAPDFQKTYLPKEFFSGASR